MGERVCYLAVCPNCDLRVSVADETCPECGADLDTDESGQTGTCEDGQS